MTPQVCDTLELDSDTFEIIRVRHLDEANRPVAPDPADVPAAWRCSCCGRRRFRCVFGLVGDRLHLVALVPQGGSLDQSADPDWTLDDLQLHRLPGFSGVIVVAKDRLTLDEADDAVVQDYTDVAPWAEFDTVLELVFKNGVLRSRIDASTDAVRARERGRDGEAPVDG